MYICKKPFLIKRGFSFLLKFFGRFNMLSAVSFRPKEAKKDAATIINATNRTKGFCCSA